MEMPLMNVVEGAEAEEAPLEEPMPEEGAMGNPYEEAMSYAEKAEVLATDCETVAATVPAAAEHAKEARLAADAANAALPDVEAAQTAYDGAIATAGSESPEATQAMRDLEDAAAIIKTAFETALQHCDEAKVLMPQLETGAEPGEGGLADWANRTAAGE